MMSMMQTRLLNLLLACAFTSTVGAKDLYLIAGMPSNSEVPAHNFATTLLMLDEESNSLDRVRTITNKHQGSHFIRLYDDLGLGVVASSGGPGLAQFDLIQYQDPAANVQIESSAGADRFFPVKVLMLDLPEGPMIGIMDSKGVLGSAENPVVLKTTGLSLDGREHNLGVEAYLSALSAGGGDGEGLYVPPDSPLGYFEAEGQFLLGIPGQSLKPPFSGPDLSHLKNKNGLSQVIKNRSILVLASYETVTHRDNRTFIKYLVLDRKSGRWSTTEVERSRGLKAFGSKLAFVIAYSDGPEYQGPRVPVSNQPTAFTLGAKDRLPDLAMTGEIVLIDTAGKDRATFRVDSGDCDVLFVGSDGDVLYRVRDTIYRRRWQGNEITEPTPVVTHTEIVPAIHWAFRGGQ